MSKEKLIPELRFPEFEKFGEWFEQSLGELVKIGSGYSPSKYQLYDKGIFPFVKVEDLNNCDKYQNSSRQYTNESEDVIPVKSIIFPKRGAAIQLNKVRIAQKELLLDTNIMAITPVKNVEPEFLYYVIFNVGLHKIADSSTIPQINNKHIVPFEITIPPKAEQQKIAFCLSSLDELLAAHNDKLDALKDHKKGLLQNLFPQEIETVPKVRFPEFEGDGEWVEKKLGDVEVSAFVNDKIDSEKLTLKNYISTDNMLPDYSGVAEASKLPTTNRVTEFLKGDILISNIRPYLKKVWKSDRNGGASNDVLIFRSGSSVVSDFLEFILKNDAFINYVMQSAKGVKMPRGDKDSMLKYPTRIPKKEEQQKIASCLSAVDELITAQLEKIEQLQQHKKGLMQGLFPNPLASTGETI